MHPQAVDASSEGTALPRAETAAALAPAGEQTLAEAMRKEDEALRRRFVHHTRPRGPLSLREAIALSERMK